MGNGQLDFQRARRPEQREIRKQAILDTAASLLGEKQLTDISLRELGRRSGISKTNIGRYFESREAVFFELLNRTLSDWLDEIDADLPPAPAPGEPAPAADLLTAAWARSLAGQPLLCELWSSLGSVLERNLSAEAVRTFKLTNLALRQRLAVLVQARAPQLTDAAANELVNLSVVLLTGLWPFANPSPSVMEATDDARLLDARIDFADRFGRALQLAVTGLTNDPAA
jgi:AcrR family transcriptional regulator